MKNSFNSILRQIGQLQYCQNTGVDICVSEGSPGQQKQWDVSVFIKRCGVSGWLTHLQRPRIPRSAVGKPKAQEPLMCGSSPSPKAWASGELSEWVQVCGWAGGRCQKSFSLIPESESRKALQTRLSIGQEEFFLPWLLFSNDPMIRCLASSVIMGMIFIQATVICHHTPTRMLSRRRYSMRSLQQCG